MHVLVYPDREDIALDDELVEAPPEPDLLVTVSINVRQRVTAVREALEALRDDPGAPPRRRPKAA